MRPVLVTPPAALPVSLPDMKEHLRVSHDDEDGLITLYIGAAVSHLDGWHGVLGRCIVQQTWAQPFDGFPDGDMLRLPFADVSAVSVSYFATGSATTLAGANYRLAHDDAGAYLRLADGASWPDADSRDDAVTVTMTVGYATVPPAIIHAVKLLVGHWYRSREAVGASEMSIPLAFDALISPLRRVGI